MNIDQALRELTVVQQQLGRLLEEDGRRAIQQAKQDLERQRGAAFTGGPRRRQRHRQRQPPPWHFEISAGTPLLFVPTTVSDARHRVSVDLFCRISEPRDGLPQGEHSIVLRVWSSDARFWYRDGLDAPQLRDLIHGSGGRRVMHRVHFDLADPGQAGPRFHWQVGGTQQGVEFCWFPDSLNLPRFPHYPLNLITACEFVVRTFFPAEGERLANEPTWIGAVRVAQDAYLEPYLRDLVRSPAPLTLRPSVLQHLWNKPS